MRAITEETPIDSPAGIIGRIPQWSRHGLQVFSIINPQNELEIIHDHLEAIRQVSAAKKESALSMHSFLAFRTGRIINLKEDILVERLATAAYKLDEISAELIIEDAQGRAREYDLQTNLEELTYRNTMVKQACIGHTHALVHQLYASYHLTACANPINKEQIENEFFDTGRALGLGEIATNFAIKKARSCYIHRCEKAEFIRAQQLRAKRLGYTLSN